MWVDCIRNCCLLWTVEVKNIFYVDITGNLNIVITRIISWSLCCSCWWQAIGCRHQGLEKKDFSIGSLLSLTKRKSVLLFCANERIRRFYFSLWQHYINTTSQLWPYSLLTWKWMIHFDRGIFLEWWFTLIVFLSKATYQSTVYCVSSVQTKLKTDVKIHEQINWSKYFHPIYIPVVMNCHKLRW